MKYKNYTTLFLLVFILVFILLEGCEKNSASRKWAEKFYGKSDIKNVELIETVNDSLISSSIIIFQP